MPAHMHEVVDNCLAWQSRQDTVSHMSHYVVSSYTHHATPSTSATSSTFHAYRWCTIPTGSILAGAVLALNLLVVVPGAVVAFLFLTLLIAGIIVGAVLLGRKAHKKRMLSQRNAPQQKSSITKSSKAAKEDEGTEVHTYDVVGDDTSIDGRVTMYQELNTGNLDYVSEYAIS